MNPIPIETIINIYDTSILWSDLGPQYKGYQLSNTGIIRSMKFPKKYPYGILLNTKDNIAKLSNSLNQTEQVDIETLRSKIQLYNIPTYYINTNSRNPLITSQSNRMKKKREEVTDLQKPSGFHFKIIN